MSVAYGLRSFPRVERKILTLAQVPAQASAFLAALSVVGASFCGLETEPTGPNVSSGPGLGTLESQAFRSRAIARTQAETSACLAWKWSPLLAWL